MLEQFIINRKKEKEILLMTHLVLGYPSANENWSMVDAMVRNGVDLIELQIPFSEPTADGPTIAAANHTAIVNGFRVADAFAFAQKATIAFPHTKFLFMTYYNILFRHGVELFVEKCHHSAIAGLIVPDLPPEEAISLLNHLRQYAMDNIFIFTPTTPDDRLALIDRYASGFIYSVGRTGVTGTKTTFDITTETLIRNYRSHTRLPLAVGFGIQSKEDVDFLRGKADIAVIGSQFIKIYQQQGLAGVDYFLKQIQ